MIYQLKILRLAPSKEREARRQGMKLKVDILNDTNKY